MKSLMALLALSLFPLAALADDEPDCPDLTGLYSTVDAQGRDLKVQYDYYTCARLGRNYIYDDHEYRLDLATDGIIRQFHMSLPAFSWSYYMENILRTELVWFDTDEEGMVSKHERVSDLELTGSGDLIELVYDLDSEGNPENEVQFYYTREE
jgi:hypothetical protein